MQDKVNHIGTKFLTLISPMKHGPLTEMTASHQLCLRLPNSPSHTFTPRLTKHVQWHENALQHVTQATSIMFLSALLLFSYLGWWCRTEFKCSRSCVILSQGLTRLIPVISDFHVAVTICLSAIGCYVGCTSRIMKNSFNTFSLEDSKVIACWWM